MEEMRNEANVRNGETRKQEGRGETRTRERDSRIAGSQAGRIALGRPEEATQADEECK